MEMNGMNEYLSTDNGLDSIIRLIKTYPDKRLFGEIIRKIIREIKDE